MSQQPYQPGQPGQPGGYQQPGQSGYPQGGYQQPGPGGPPPGYGGYQGGSQYGGGGSRPNPLNSTSWVGTALQIVAVVVLALGVIAGIISLTLDTLTGSGKFIAFCEDLVSGLGFAGLLLGLAVVLKNRSS